VIEELRREFAVNSAQQLIDVSPSGDQLLTRQTINQNCFEKCVPKPDTKLGDGEKVCLGRCMERYMETWNMGMHRDISQGLMIVSRAYVSRISKESSSSDITQGGVSY
jgi:import inner membrane translocase subunit TIM13